jgi:Ca-activated chloride channel homolog
MSFDRPLLLLALLAVPAAVGIYLLAERRRMRYAIRFTNLEVLAAVMGRRPWRRYVPLALFLLALTAVCLGIARPNHETMVSQDRATVILVVDVSRSMQAEDVKPSRIRAAEAAIRTFLDRVPKRLRVGLIAFAGDPQVATPPTTDRKPVREALDSLEWFPRYGGTAIGDALAAAVELGQVTALRSGGDLAAVTVARQTHGLVSILLLSDGAQTHGMLEPEEGAARAKAAGIPVYTIALGTPNGTLERRWGFPGGLGPRRIPVPPDPATLRAIAQTTGGKFFEARSARALSAAYDNLGSAVAREPGKQEVTYWLVALGAILLVGAGTLSALVGPRLP